MSKALLIKLRPIVLWFTALANITVRGDAFHPRIYLLADDAGVPALPSGAGVAAGGLRDPRWTRYPGAPDSSLLGMGTLGALGGGVPRQYQLAHPDGIVMM